MKSVMRYEKHARVAVEMNKFGPEQQAFFLTCERELEACFLGRRAPPPAPRIVGALTG